MQLINQLTNNFLVKKNFFISILGAILGVSICYFIMYSELQDKATYTFIDGVFSSILGVFLALVISKTVLVLNKLFPWQKNVGTRMFIGFIIDFLLSLFVTIGFFYLYNLFFSIQGDFIENYATAFIKLTIILLITILIFEIIYFALYSYYTYATLQIETVKQERKQIELQLKALKSQLSPHFLFNGLNTISSLIFRDEIKAENFIRKLANMYDFTLKSYHQKLITVREELSFVESYNFLISTRFENKFICNINLSEEILETKIPPLTLQMLIENAVKHNQLSKEEPLEVKISFEESVILVQNNITKTPNNVTSFNIGLKNINQRYLLLVQKAISVIHSKEFTVKIPVIR